MGSAQSYTAFHNYITLRKLYRANALSPCWLLMTCTSTRRHGDDAAQGSVLFDSSNEYASTLDVAINQPFGAVGLHQVVQIEAQDLLPTLELCLVGDSGKETLYDSLPFGDGPWYQRLITRYRILSSEITKKCGKKSAAGRIRTYAPEGIR